MLEANLGVSQGHQAPVLVDSTLHYSAGGLGTLPAQCKLPAGRGAVATACAVV